MSITISLLAYVAIFSGQLFLVEATSSHFFRVTTLTQELLFGATISSEQLLFFPFSE